MSYKKEILYLDYPYNILFDIGVESPTQDQINGLNYVISKLDDKSKEMLFLRYKNRLSFVNIGVYYGVSKQAAYDKINRILSKLSSSKYIKYGYEGYYKKLKEITLKNKENKIIEEKNQFNDIYKRVMSKQDKNKDNIEKIRKYLFDTKNIPMEYKDVRLDYRYGEIGSEIGKCFSVRAYNCLRRAGFYNIYELLFKIYENPLYLTKVRNLGRGCFVEIFSVLYNFGYITDEQLLFLYLYYDLTCSGVSNFDELKSFCLNRNRG